MFLRLQFLWILIVCKAAAGEDVLKAVNAEASFTPVAGSVVPSTTSSITWKHKDNAGVVVKVVEWDREGDITEIPNAKFRSHASLDKHTGELTLQRLQLAHSGVYTIDINSKTQRIQFTLKVMEPVRKPHVAVACLEGSPECSLSCDADASSDSTVIWRDSAGEIMAVNNNWILTVTNSSAGENFYTCTVKNDVSEETSDPVYERDLFDDSRIELIIAITVLLIAGIIVMLCAAMCKTMCSACCE